MSISFLNGVYGRKMPRRTMPNDNGPTEAQLKRAIKMAAIYKLKAKGKS